MNSIMTLKPLVLVEPDTLEMKDEIIDCVIQEVVRSPYGELIFLGIPSNETDGDGNSLHNCDQMGCGQSHVIYRFYQYDK